MALGLDAIAIDKGGGMIDEIRRKVSEGLATWGGELPRFWRRWQ